MSKSDKQISELYKIYFDYVLHESKAVWDTGQLFLVANTFFSAILGVNIPTEQNTYKIIFWLLSLIGLAISVLWLISFERIKKHYYFRMTKAKKLEKEEGFIVFSGDAENLAKGGVKKINGEKFDYKLFGLLNLSSFVCLKIIIIVFMIFYLYLIIQYFPKN